ncbi:class I SAM-dependent methyltransferase [Galbibacter sp. EGI 63066]|uniref:class I SAM-dependent methyltransferase n=1 Tax=Galbibacter sp. EGI 63066 TaxID=2993559 RepID=UPI002B05F50B|nr:hypothetical protein [Galbibacter sp. EGI 63066]
MSFLLKNPHFKDVTTKEIAEQIESKKKAEKKLPTWFKTDLIYYPNKLNLEQTSSEETARYKARLVSGKTLLDLTGGFGVDSYFFAEHFDEVFHCEINKELSEIAGYNFKILGKSNIHSIPENGLDFLTGSKRTFDCIFIDPSRRDLVKNKVFLLQDCLPDMTKILPQLFEKSDRVMVKTSPLLDITKGIEELDKVKEIHVVAVNNEVKELLWLLDNRQETDDISVKTINIKKQGNDYFSFKLSNEAASPLKLTLPSKYLYEPNAAILKSGGFNTIAKKLSLNKLHPNTHLYTSDKAIDFPGRSFIIKEVLSYNKKALKKVLPNNKAHITTRNFPESVAQIRKKTKIQDGGDIYLFFCTNFNNEKIVLLTKKL